MPRQHENDPRMTDSPQFHQITLMVGGLKQAVETMTGMWHQQELAATEGRRALHEKFENFREEMRVKMTDISGRVDRLAAQVKVIEPSVSAFNEEKLRDEGAKRLGKFLMAGLMSVAGLLGWGMHELIGWFLHR
jgi:hypothetical protein